MNLKFAVRFAALILVIAAAIAYADPYPGAGIFMAGDLWETVYPTGVANKAGGTPVYYEVPTDPGQVWNLVRLGNLERQWTTPTTMYPAWGDQHLVWAHTVNMVEYSPDPINNFTKSTDPRAKNYVYGFYRSSVKGDVKHDNAAVYDSKRSMQTYTASFPTNLGINVRMRVRQFANNFANLNDIIFHEYELTNTGALDADGDGTAEKTNNRINALTLLTRYELINSMTNSNAGRRGASGWFTGPIEGYDNSPDADGAPWAVPVVFSGPSPGNLKTTKTFTVKEKTITVPWADDGARSLGITMNPRQTYQDIYSGDSFIAVKQGKMDDGPTAPDKKTIFDSHPIGVGKERGWYLSVAKGYGNNDHFPYEDHTLAMGTFYANGGKVYDRTKFDMSPDPNYFDVKAPGTKVGNPLTFVPKPAGQRGRPDGSMKYLQTFAENWELGNPNPDDDWIDGYSRAHGFDGDMIVGIGPFSMEVGETITVTMIQYAGFRLMGIRNAVKTARWVYENNYKVPELPAAPDVKIDPSVDIKINVKWDDRAEQDPGFAGYKVYRSTAFPQINSLEVGVRTMDRYTEQTDPSQDLKSFGMPNNPNISYTGYRLQDPGAWGPWKLVANIPKANLASVLNADADKTQYKYSWKDASDLVAFGYTYWYYVAAYSSRSGSVAGKNYTTVESGHVNVNGASGNWEGTYPFAVASSFYPKDFEGLKRLGASFVLKAPLADPQKLVSGTLKIKVKPNPYKQRALHDVGLEHKLLFYNLPTGTKITIFDVSGQIIDQLHFTGTNPQDGTLFWDMFSKDGTEVQSGLYIYVAEYPGGKQTGYFSIIR